MTRTVADNALLFDACLGHDPRDPTSMAAFEAASPSVGKDIRGLRIAVLEEFNAEADGEILAAFDGALSLLKDLGAEVVPVTCPPVSLYNDCARLLIQEVGRASVMARVCQYVYLSVVAFLLKKTHKMNKT